MAVALVLASGASTPAHAEDVPTPRLNPHKSPSETAFPGFAAFGDTEQIGPAPGSWNGETPPAAIEESLALGAGTLAQPLGLAPVDESFPLGNGSFGLVPGAAPGLGAGPPGKSDALLGPGRGPESYVLGTFTIDARLTEDTPPLDSGVTWRVFSTNGGEDGKLRLVGQADGGPVTLRLRPGDYFVHAAYGRAGVAKKVTVGPAVTHETLDLNAGGLRLTAMVGDGKPLPAENVTFDIYAEDEGGSEERILLVRQAPASEVIGLNAGIYQVVCRYGDANAIVRADIKIEPGKLTEATIYQQAARLTLKLVNERGGEALANTSWSVVTPAGDSVVDSVVGAFPSVVLLEGEYTAVAKHQDKIYEQDFTVEPGVDRDVEVLVEQARE